MSSISMLHKAGTTFLPSSLATRNQTLPVSQNSSTITAAAADPYRSSSNYRKISCDKDNKEELLNASAGGQGGEGIRRRLSSLSLHNLQDSISSSPAASWAAAANVNFQTMRCKSSMGLEHAGSSIRRWWELGWAWMLSRKPTFAQDLEMNDEETSFLGSHNKGSWRHVFYKLRSELTKLLLRSSSSNSLPQTFSYNVAIYNQKKCSSASIRFPSCGGR